MTIKLEVVHLIRGRARIAVHSGINPETLFVIIKALLQNIPEVRMAEFNSWAKSFTVYFKGIHPDTLFEDIKKELEDIVCNPNFCRQLAQIEEAMESGRGGSLTVTVRDHIMSVSRTLDQAVKDMTGNTMDMKTLVPVTSFAAGLAMLTLAPGIPTPTWLVLLIFGFTGFHVGHNPLGGDAWQSDDAVDTPLIVLESTLTQPESEEPKSQSVV